MSDRKNPLWVVIESGERDRGWLVFYSKEQAVEEFEKRLDREMKNLESQKDYLIKHYEEEGELIKGECPCVLNYDVSVVMHELVTVDGVEYSVDLGYGQFVVQPEKNEPV